MKQLIIFPLLLFISTIAFAQDVVHWNYSSKKISDKTYELHLTATIDEGWHVYAQVQPKDAVGLPTKIVFNKNPLITLAGKTKEIGNKKKQEIKEVGITQYYYPGKVDFVQTIKLKISAKTNCTGTIEFMACTDEKCLPAKTVNFSIKLD